MKEPIVINSIGNIIFSLDYVQGEEINEKMGERYYSFIFYDGDTEKQYIYALPESSLDRYKTELAREGVYLTDFTTAYVNELLRLRKPGVPFCEYNVAFNGMVSIVEKVEKKVGEIEHEREQYYTRLLLQSFIDDKKKRDAEAKGANC